MPQEGKQLIFIKKKKNVLLYFYFCARSSLEFADFLRLQLLQTESTLELQFEGFSL